MSDIQCRTLLEVVVESMQEIFHLVNRGVDKRKIFLDKQDYFRFIHDLFEFNDRRILESTSRPFQKLPDIECRTVEQKPRKLLVRIYAFCLMPNHYHLLVSPCMKDGIPKFMHKVNMGYSKYFNIKYERSGTLFQGRYKFVRVQKEIHFLYLPYYIHFNPLDLKFPEWRDYKIHNYKDAVQFLESYRWSSHLDYLGKKNFPSITQRDFLLEIFEGVEGYRDRLYSWLKEADLSEMRKLILE